MEIQKLPLTQRLERVKAGLNPFPEFAAHAIHSMAQTPICAYLGGYDEQQLQLYGLLKLRPFQLERMTYEEVATKIYLMRVQDGRERKAGEATELLTAPFDHCGKDKPT